jgi:hypothetical protein
MALSIFSKKLRTGPLFSGTGSLLVPMMNKGLRQGSATGAPPQRNF